MEESDVILLLTDAQQGVTEADREIVQILRRRQSIVAGANHPPIILVVNKADSEHYRTNALDFYSLGLGDPFPISAIHGTAPATCWMKWLRIFRSQSKTKKKMPASKWRLWASRTLENQVC
jgi:GTP-binding protein